METQYDDPVAQVLDFLSKRPGTTVKTLVAEMPQGAEATKLRLIIRLLASHDILMADDGGLSVRPLTSP